MRVFCVKCDKTVEAALVKGDEIYPHRPDLYNLNFYQCPNCGGFVGTHKGTTRPLGCIPTEQLKMARKKLHAKMDPLWKSGYISRQQLYKRISNELGYTYHNGETRSVQECLRVYDIIDGIEKELLPDNTPEFMDKLRKLFA